MRFCINVAFHQSATESFATLLVRWRRLCLRYSQGKNCYKLNEVNYSTGVPGYVARANKLGYRAVAGPSGTTANILQYGLVRVCSLSIVEVAVIQIASHQE